METKQLFHATTWSALAEARPGDRLVLVPGSQGAEGIGVYFAEGQLRVEAADAVHVSGTLAAVVVIEVATSTGWWRTKSGRAKKHGRPRTWHSAGKKITLTVMETVEVNGTPHVYCDWGFN